jgi:Domain of unknown function (DUF4157)
MHLQVKPTSNMKSSFRSVAGGFLQRKCACGEASKISGECAECGKKHLSLQRATVYPSRLTPHASDVPPIVRDILRSTGQPLDDATRAFMEPRFGHDFSKVRVHTGERAADSAQAVNTLAYTVGSDVVFGAGQYSPASPAGKSLLAHELAHVVQQSQGPGLEAESRADAAAARVVRGESVTPEMMGGASPGLHAQNDEEQVRRAPTVEPAFNLSWDALAQPGMFQLPPPMLRLPTPRPPTLGVPGLTPPSLTPPLLTPPTLLPGPRPTGPGLPGLTPPFTPPSPTTTGAPEPPSRLPVLNRGRFSLGLRLGFPEAEAKEIPGARPSTLAESLRRAEIVNQMLTGTVPTGWEAIDKAQLARAVWGIFSTHIAPDLARSITRGLSVPTGPGGASLELDLVLLTDFSGGGLSFTLRH